MSKPIASNLRTAVYTVVFMVLFFVAAIWMMDYFVFMWRSLSYISKNYPYTKIGVYFLLFCFFVLSSVIGGFSKAVEFGYILKIPKPLQKRLKAIPKIALGMIVIPFMLIHIICIYVYFILMS